MSGINTSSAFSSLLILIYNLSPLLATHITSFPCVLNHNPFSFSSYQIIFQTWRQNKWSIYLLLPLGNNICNLKIKNVPLPFNNFILPSLQTKFISFSFIIPSSHALDTIIFCLKICEFSRKLFSICISGCNLGIPYNFLNYIKKISKTK